MKLLEYEAKKIIADSGISIPDGKIISSAKDVTAPVVLKSQVLAGRRNKYGGIQIVHTDDAIEPAFTKIMSSKIDGHTPHAILAEELLNIRQEYYLSVIINKESASLELLALAEGGVDIESHDKTEFFREQLSPQRIPIISQKLAEFLELETHVFQLEDLLQKLHRCFAANDATLLEINPLVYTSDERLVAADCKMTLDDAAAFRHSDWIFFDTTTSHNFITLNQDGTVATIANGAGLAMATVDAVEDSNLQVANFLDIGGGASKETVLASFRKITEYPNVKAILINIFAGITRCDEVAKAIIAASEEIPQLPKLYIRLEGTNRSAAERLLNESAYPLYRTLPNALDALKKELA